MIEFENVIGEQAIDEDIEDSEDFMSMIQNQSKTILEELTKYECFENLVSGHTTTIKKFSKDIDRESLNILKDAVGANIVILYDISEMDAIEKECDAILQEEKGDIYNIVYIKEDILDEVSELTNSKFDTQDLMKEEDIANETSKILAG